MDAVSTDTQPDLTHARVAYEAYGVSVGGVNYQGNPLPDFADVGEKIQNAWAAAAAAVRSV